MSTWVETRSRPRVGPTRATRRARMFRDVDTAVHLHACATDGVFVPTGGGPPAFLPARPIIQADLATLTEKVRRRVVRWFRMQRLLDADAAADMLARENSGFSVDASVRITLIDRDVPSYFQSLEHLLRYCARPPFALNRLSVIRGEDGRATKVRYVLPRHKAANWVGPGRGRKSTRPGASGVVELSPFEFLDRLADLVPPPRKHRHRYHGVFAPNHKLRSAVTALAIGNVGKRRDAATGGHAFGGHAADGDATGHGCDSCDKPPSHDTSRRQRPNSWPGWARSFRWSARGVVATSASSRSLPIRGRSGRSLHPCCFIQSGEPLEPPPVSPARLSRPWPTDRLGRPRAGPQRMRRDSDVARRTARDRHSQPLTGSHVTVRTAREKGGFKAGLRRRDKSGLERG